MGKKKKKKIEKPYRKVLEERAREMRNNPTPAEKKMGYQLMNCGVEYKKQVPIVVSHRQKIGYIVDFLLPANKTVIEVDGTSHIGKEMYDYKRTEYLKDLGYRVLRIPNEDVFNLTKVKQLLNLSA